MAPNKFEKQLKDTLERRTIAPSKTTWSQLDTLLEQRQDKRKVSLWWLSIAATLVGVCLTVFVFKNQSNNINGVVEEVKNEIHIPSKTQTVQSDIIVNTEDTNDDTVKVAQEQTQKQNNNIVITQPAKKTATKNVVSENLKPVVIEDEAIALNTASSNVVSNVNEESQLEETVIVNNQIINNEVDQLLNKAYAKVKAANTGYKSEKIDANSLLDEIEMTSEKSLKNRLFHAVKSGYETLRTTVVERDN
ncbi:hypothetical protein [Psychroserpens sp. NJDZ02]|uniref:hypothetical protein n=1 Tax=Psychroserpens sp. NJDZ02 TaxID=2570561 RepID=UPI0010A81E44|nr:hypothetical protein [Psychroserpens sp. NJDZ02]QCE40578.1 hypothetical protein E9099_03805 [Psychroserpens sp. NJDZ02]